MLALKLVPGVGVQSMQPVRVTSQGAAPSLPLRMVAVGTGPTTGITVWVVADGRWAPTSFPTFTINPSEMVWDWTTSSSNYETLRLAREASYMGSGLQIESSLELNQGGIQQSLLSNVGFVAHARRWPWTARERSSCLSDSRVGHASTAARHSQQTPSGGVYVGMTRPTTGRAPGLPGEIHRRRAAHAERLDVEPALVAQEEHVEGARGEVRVGHADENPRASPSQRGRGSRERHPRRASCPLCRGSPRLTRSRCGRATLACGSAVEHALGAQAMIACRVVVSGGGREP